MRATVLLLAMPVMASLSNLLARESPSVRVVLKPEGDAYVGQHVSIDVDVLTSEIIFGEPKIDLPEVDGGVLLRSSTQATRSSVTVDGKDYQQTQYAFAFFPHRAGTAEIPPIRLRFPEKVGITEPLASETVTVTAVMPEGAEGLSTLVSTTEFEVKESWSPQPADARVGDAFKRTVTMKAESVLGMGFPPLPVRDIDGLGIYTGDPLVRDTSNRGEFSGERSQTITYVCEREGAFEIPAMTVPWFDLSLKDLKRIELPGHQFAVAPNPALQRASEGTAAASGVEDPNGGSWAIGLIAAVLLGGVVFAFRRRIRQGIGTWLHSRRESESVAFRKLCQVARRGDPKSTYKALADWAGRRGVRGGIQHMLATADSPELQTAIEKLSALLFGKKRTDQQAHWDGGPQIARLLGRLRRLKAQRSSATSTDLKPLNP